MAIVDSTTATAVVPLHYDDDAQEDIENYFKCLQDKDPVPAALMAISRLNSKSVKFRVSCLRRCSPYLNDMMTPEEKKLSEVCIWDDIPAPEETHPSTTDDNSPSGRWQSAKSKPNAISCPSMDKLMGMIGLKSVKEMALQLYENALCDRCIPAKYHVPQSHNFIFVGNPGTGIHM